MTNVHTGHFNVSQVVPVVSTQPVVYQNNTPPRSNKKEHYHGNSAKVLGYLHISIAGLAITFNIISLALHEKFPVGQGIWSGIFFIITGVFGITSGLYKTTGHIVAFLVLSIISACWAIFAFLVCAAIGTGMTVSDRWGYHYQEYSYNRVYNYNTDSRKDAILAMNVLMIILALAECVVSIVSSGFGCHGACCCEPRAQGGVVLYHNAGAQVITGGGVGGQVLYYSQQGTTTNVMMNPQLTQTAIPPQPALQQPNTSGYPDQTGTTQVVTQGQAVGPPSYTQTVAMTNTKY